MEQQNKIIRKKYLINTKFQLKYTGLILLFMFVVAWLTGYTVYYTGWLLMGEKLSAVYPQGRLVAIMRTVNFTLLLRLALITPLVVVISIILSHRIAGPVFRIGKYLKSIASGDLSAKLHLRKNDELQDLAEAINEMTGELKSRVNKVKGLVNMAGLELEKFKMTLDSESLNVDAVKEGMEDLTKSIKDLDDYLSKYRLTTIED
ncbi:MAG: methyl-accepting chemotaxis protein [Candidatus Omnitrophica bacterium]|nr:methyl-accepting chemotaxis protein [Candidatus Omnitrophota bacterium]